MYHKEQKIFIHNKAGVNQLSINDFIFPIASPDFAAESSVSKCSNSTIILLRIVCFSGWYKKLCYIKKLSCYNQNNQVALS